jgi:hypothetical protein
MNEGRLERIRADAKAATPAEMFVTEYDGAVVDPLDVLDLVTEVKRLRNQKAKWKPKMHEAIAKYLDQREKAIKRAHAAEAEVRRVHTAIEALRTDLWPKCVTGWSLPGDVNNAVDHALKSIVGTNPVTGKEGEV